jgi:2-dehydro-3-deoxygalactonokinase
MIGVDWGTSSLRAYRIGADGAVLARIDRPGGILTVPPGGFANALADLVAPWLAEGEHRILACGMVGSRQGWVEAPYLPCPADLASLAGATIPLPFGPAEARLVPGLITRDADGVPDVMRGEETKLLALPPEAGLACLPGTHCKWARRAGGRILGFTTHMTGEVFGALANHTILARTRVEAPHDPAAFARGLARAAEPGGLLHHLFGTRTLHLLGELPAEATDSYLSGLLIGHEVAQALAATGATAVDLLGADRLAPLYAAALEASGVTVRRHDPDLVAAGLHAIAGALGWT